MPIASDLPRLARTRPAPRAGIVHFGPGAFFRAFIAPFTQEAMDVAGGDWGIIAVALRNGQARDQLKPQGCAYTALTLAPDGPERQVIDCITDVLVARENPDALIETLADPAIRIVTLTITEKGYGHDPITGQLNPDLPDMAHDLAYPDAPRSAPGFIVAGLARRRAAGVAPFSVISCDNLAGNSAILRAVILGLARAHDPALADWIAAHGAFPATMVDRITPAMPEAEAARLAQEAGIHDAAITHHEPFRQWIIAADFVGGARPAWDRVGAQIVGDVAPFEAMKLRCLNGAHSALAYLGLAAGHATVAAAVADPALRGFIAALWAEEVIPTLAPPEGADPAAYCAALMARFANPAIAHRLAQIAMDGSQKLGPRILSPMATHLVQGRATPRLAMVVAAWMHHLSGPHLADPMADTLRARAGDPTALLALSAIFPPALADDPRFRAQIIAAWDKIAAQGVQAALA